MTDDLLTRVLAGKTPAYALLHRPDSASGGDGVLDVLTGTIAEIATLADIPLADIPLTGTPLSEDPEREGPERERPGAVHHDVLVVAPYRQIAERGYACPDDGEPLLAMTVTEQSAVTVAEALRRLPDLPTTLVGGHFDVDDAAYAETVRKVVAEEIGTGEGANFVIKRTYVADITGYTPHSALSFFRRLLAKETGAYWTYLVHTGGRTFVGATPERHVSLADGTAVMNPISGTYRYPATGPDLPGVMDFLADRKEADELYMVVDEELKMMARICPGGGRAVGPYLKEMARLAHTEYFIEGRTDRDPREILRETLFAPTVTGSPLESACRVIDRYEPQGRGYYSGVLALIGRDARGAHAMDSAILIRSADIDAGGRVRIGVGATLVRHSDPDAEARETRAKAAGLLAALEAGPARFADHPDVRAALASRNDRIAGYWLRTDGERVRPVPALQGRKVLVVDAEDTFTSMIAHQLRSMGLEVTVRRYDEPYRLEGYDLYVMGPGPGDPRETAHPKIAHMRAAIGTLLDQGQPFVAVCLSHQILSTLLGLDLVRRDVPNQGVQREIDLFGRRERVGFYNAFAARGDDDKIDSARAGVVQVCREDGSGEVHALRGNGFASMQFHAESVLTEDGVRIVAETLEEVLRTCVS
ncbi:anthranilate synthase family protein [Streptomyces sp. UNOC14_S4]|uniref:anthranilate synthase family protein n=1 Tax=Streptomyces sp. UNOC14_S4 TaxID=2872340 RepID=UPI001E2E97A2|nr:anthranilate synthase family protein [Streptomyces sp. UNOC14_S4]MCC3767948.1 anthranilate synthase family protein [Streptomyces sp. UNOC14_S4]